MVKQHENNWRENIFDLNPEDAIRNPDSLPPIMKRAIANIMMDFEAGRRQAASGSLKGKFTQAFNIISAKFGRDFKFLKRDALNEGRIELSGTGRARQQVLKREDALKRQAARKRQLVTGKKSKLPTPEHTRIAYLDRILRRLKNGLD